MTEEQKNFPKYSSPQRTILGSAPQSVLEDWNTYINSIQKYPLNEDAIEATNNILYSIKHLRRLYYILNFNFSQEFIKEIDNSLKEISSAYISHNSEKLDELLFKISKYLLSFLYKIQKRKDQKSNFDQPLNEITNSYQIDIQELLYKIQEVYDKTNYNLLYELLNLFKLYSFGNNIQEALWENISLRKSYMLLNEYLDKLLSVTDINLIHNQYLYDEISIVLQEFNFNLKLHFLAKNIHPNNINTFVELTNNLDQAQKKLDKLDEQITQDYKNISKNILPQFQKSYDQYTEMLSSLEERIKSLQAECSNLELAHYFKKEADKLKVDTDITHGWWRLTQEYVYHPYSRWLLLTIIGMISIFSLTFYITFSLEANINNYQDLIKYSPMYMVLGWFTWFSSKQFSYIKQLHDEYRYKYVLSKSYFAYRKEAENLVTDNKEALLLLLKCVIANISTSPVQSVRPDVHTPFSEILNTVSKAPLKPTDDKK